MIGDKTVACVGGTLNRIHAGHRLLLRTAFNIADLVRVGVTSDAMVERLRGPQARAVRPAASRIKDVERLLAPYGRDRFTVTLLENAMEPVNHPEFDAIVVSNATLPTAERINAARSVQGHSPLKIVVVGMLLADDGKPISSSRILAGEIDEEGHLPQARASAPRAKGKAVRKQAAPRKSVKKRRPTGTRGAKRAARVGSKIRKGTRVAGPRGRR